MTDENDRAVPSSVGPLNPCHALKTRTSDGILAVVHRNIVFVLALPRTMDTPTATASSTRRHLQEVFVDTILDSASESSLTLFLDHCSLYRSKWRCSWCRFYTCSRSEPWWAGRACCSTVNELPISMLDSWPSVCLQLVVTELVVNISRWNWSQSLRSPGLTVRGSHRSLCSSMTQKMHITSRSLPGSSTRFSLLALAFALALSPSPSFLPLSNLRLPSALARDLMSLRATPS